MTSILITYGTGEGQTAKIAGRIESVLSDRGFDVRTAHVGEMASVSIDDFDAVLVGGSINDRQHRPEVVEFVREHRDRLASRPNGFFQVSMASAFANMARWSEWAREGERRFVDALIEETGWEPDVVGPFAGAIKYPQYSPLLRLGFRAFSAISTGDTDTSHEYEYTDWDAVEGFAIDFGEYVDRELERGGLRRLTRRPVARRTRGRMAALLVLGVGLVGVAFWVVRNRRESRIESTGDFETVTIEADSEAELRSATRPIEESRDVEEGSESLTEDDESDR